MPAKKILCIEDELELREDIAEFLRGEDFDVYEANNGQDGIEKFYKIRPDIVLCDIKMPGMTGFEMLEKLNHESPSEHPLCPFVFLTAWADQGHCLTGKGLGCDDYLLKPIDFDVLLTTLHSRLKLWEKMKDAGDKKLNQFRHEMLSVLNTHLKNPMHSIVGYADMLNNTDHDAMQRFKDEVGGMVKKNVTVIQNIMDSITLALDEHSLQLQPVSFENLVWEALAMVNGVEHLEMDGLIDFLDEHSHTYVLADHELMLKLMRNLIQESGLVNGELPYVSCKHAKSNEIDIVIASSKRRAQDTSHWISLDDETVDGIDELMQFRAVSLIHAQSVVLAHEGMFRVDIANVYDPVYKLRLKTTRPV